MKFSALRTAFVEAAYGYEGAIIDASTAKDFGAEAQLQAALYTAEHNMALIHMLQREMAIVAKKIDELGPYLIPRNYKHGHVDVCKRLNRNEYGGSGPTGTGELAGRVLLGPGFFRI